MPELWMPGVVHHPLPDSDTGMQTQYPPRAIAHITWDAKPVSFEALFRYFTGDGQSKAPHILWDPITGKIGQFYPATSRSKSVADRAGGTRTNRTGRVCIQIEALLSPGKTTYNGRVCQTLLDTPCKGWDQLLAWVCSWGVPCVWPMGMPDFASHRNERVWEAQGGWYGHSQVPENTHTDPGPWPAFPPPKPTSEKDDDMTPEQDALLTYVSKQVKAVADLVILLDGRRATQIQALGTAIDANVDAETTEIDGKLAELKALLAASPGN
jgi:hypothetical protein